MKHWDTHPQYIEDCQPCKWASLSYNTDTFTKERKGEGPMGDQGTRAYVEKMYEDRRREGRADPVPTTKEAAKFAPAAGVARDKNYKKNNGGL